MPLKKEFVRFRLSGKSKSGKTNVWQVETQDGSIELGEIRWCGRWRRYAFHPLAHTIYEQECLRSLAAFCEEQSTKARQSWASKK